MCGIIALLLADTSANVAAELYDGLNLLQHRGQVPLAILFVPPPFVRIPTLGYQKDAAGIITCLKGRLYQVKGNGLVRDVFTQAGMSKLVGNMGVAHGTACTSFALD